MRIVLVSLFFERTERALALARAMSRHGHEVVFLTGERVSEERLALEPFTVVTIPFRRYSEGVRHALGVAEDVNVAQAARARGALAGRLARFLAHAWEATFLYPDKYRGWIEACRGWMRENRATLGRADVVVAAAAPFSAQYVGRDLAASLECPLVLDFLDLWVSGNPYYPFGPVRAIVDRRAEARLIEDADASVTASESFAEALSRAYPQAPVTPIYIGVDPTPWRSHPRTRSDALRIAHFGITYEGRRDVRPLLRTLARLGETGRIDLARVRLDMWGEYDEPARMTARELGLESVVRARGTVPPAEVPGALAQTDVALLIMWPDDLVNFPLKTRHYLAAGNHLLVIGAGQNSEVERWLGHLDGVDLCPDDVSLDAAVVRLWERWKAGEALGVDETSLPYMFTDEAMYAQFMDVICDAIARHA